MKTLIITLSTVITLGLTTFGGVSLYNASLELQQKQTAQALKTCEKNNFKGWVKLKGDFTVYQCKADSRSVEII